MEYQLAFGMKQVSVLARQGWKVRLHVGAWMEQSVEFLMEKEVSSFPSTTPQQDSTTPP